MVLFTHEMVGAALAVAVKANPVEAFFIGIVSHYILDVIPHWHYKVMRDGSKPATQWEETGMSFLKKSHAGVLPYAYWKATFDVVGGAACMIGFAFTYNHGMLLPIISAMIGSVLPDVVTFVSKIWPAHWLDVLRKFHTNYLHRKYLDDRPLLGIGSQVLLCLCAFLLAFVFR